MTDKNQSKDNKSAESAEELGFLAHLIELRTHMVRIVVSLFVVFLPLAVFAKELFSWFAQPIVSQGLPLLSIDVTGPVFVPYKLALLVSFLIALPYIFYQLWAFVAPGLYKHEKKLIFPLLASSVGLFYLGVAFVYYALLPMMFQIMPLFLPVEVTYSPDIASYLNFAIVMFFAFGFAFEMPIATILLISTGMTTAESLAKKRPYVIVGAFIVGMILTPPDMISQVMLAIPMWLLFELGLVLSGVFKKRIKEAVDSRDKMEEERVSAVTAMAAGGSAAAVNEAANKLWEDENYEYEEYDENDGHQQLTDEELDAELERIESEEEAEEKKKSQQAKNLEKPDSDAKK
ncbi:MAG: twin-arginine translocase subunit TatC [Cocleimonas sp.]|nr:twin-arginine translocase subunit TatC [Cocleimonas sp.]